MTQDEIIELAEQAGMTRDGDMWFSNGKGDMDVEHKHLEAFAKLVAEKVNADWSETNERLIKVFNEKADLAYLSGAKEEREACAKVCDDIHAEYEAKDSFSSYAEAIRARGQA